MSLRFRLPHHAAPYLFAGLTSGLMSFLVSGLATWKAFGFVPDLLGRWISAWVNAWPIAFASLLIVAPAVRRLVGMMVAPPTEPPELRARNGA
ncbi:MAG: DUF2798 domain-containing protein [Hyphomicrobiaceae bacterium]|nr:DUF2798 domain-containing protein [Hyphomicrobiaceae bacterium]